MQGSSEVAHVRIHCLALMLFDMLHTGNPIFIPHATVSDPYAPKTEKQIPFYKGFILVMRHGPYLTLTAAFLFITVAIQVNVNLFILVVTVNKAVLDPDAQC